MTKATEGIKVKVTLEGSFLWVIVDELWDDDLVVLGEIGEWLGDWLRDHAIGGDQIEYLDITRVTSVSYRIDGQ